MGDVGFDDDAAGIGFDDDVVLIGRYDVAPEQLVAIEGAVSISIVSDGPLWPATGSVSRRRVQAR